MTDLTLPARQYRWLDRLTKLGGVGLVAAGLGAGGGTVEGLVLAAAGVGLGVSTVFVDEGYRATESDRQTETQTARPTDE